MTVTWSLFNCIFQNLSQVIPIFPSWQCELGRIIKHYMAFLIPPDATQKCWKFVSRASDNSRKWEAVDISLHDRLGCISCAQLGSDRFPPYWMHRGAVTVRVVAGYASKQCAGTAWQGVEHCLALSLAQAHSCITLNPYTINWEAGCKRRTLCLVLKPLLCEGQTALISLLVTPRDRSTNFISSFLSRRLLVSHPASLLLL